MPRPTGIPHYRYKTALVRRNHQVSTTDNGEHCLRIYRDEFNKVTSTTDPTEHIQPFDAVVLDYKMPKINGMDVAKQILTVNPRQRIILAIYVKEDVSIESLNQLNASRRIAAKTIWRRFIDGYNRRQRNLFRITKA